MITENTINKIKNYDFFAKAYRVIIYISTFILTGVGLYFHKPIMQARFVTNQYTIEQLLSNLGMNSDFMIKLSLFFLNYYDFIFVVVFVFYMYLTYKSFYLKAQDKYDKEDINAMFLITFLGSDAVIFMTAIGVFYFSNLFVIFGLSVVPLLLGVLIYFRYSTKLCKNVLTQEDEEKCLNIIMDRIKEIKKRKI
jgi:hypothetical protein